MLDKNIPLSQYSNYRIGGPSRWFFSAKNTGELKEAIALAQEKDLPIFILGGGTNLLISDEGFAGLTLKPDLKELVLEQGDRIRAGAGVLMADLLEFAAAHELSGLEWAGGLPGTVGGAVRGNAGCFGAETKDNIVSVRSLDTKTLKEIERDREACRFDYRNSFFKENDGKEVILSATFGLAKGEESKIRSAAQEKIDYRQSRHPMEYPNIGSIFKNIPVADFEPAVLAKMKSVIKDDPFPVVPVAYLIAQADLRGVSCGGAMISPKHPNFIVNVLSASSEDVRSLMALVKATIKDKFGVEPEPEVIEV